VEGAEFVAVRGLEASLSQLPERAEVVVEVGPDRAGDASDVGALFATFERAGYVGYAIPNGYTVMDYLAYTPSRAFPRVDAALLIGQVDVVFSRTRGDELLVDPS
jgi:hypothetical protein